MNQLLDFLAQAATPPHEAGADCDPHKPLSAIVFKTVADPFGRITYFKVTNGTFKGDGQLFNATKNKSERVGQAYLLRGKEQIPVPTIEAGDIGAVVKLQETNTNDTISAADKPTQLKQIEFPAPLYRAAITPKTKADLEKMGEGVVRPTLGDIQSGAGDPE